MSEVILHKTGMGYLYHAPRDDFYVDVPPTTRFNRIKLVGKKIPYYTNGSEEVNFLITSALETDSVFDAETNNLREVEIRLLKKLHAKYPMALT